MNPNEGQEEYDSVQTELQRKEEEEVCSLIRNFICIYLFIVGSWNNSIVITMQIT